MEDPLLLNVWREACRHIRIGESTTAIAQLLVTRVPVGRVVVRRIDATKGWLETVAVAFDEVDHPLEGVRTLYGPNDLQRILAWFNTRCWLHAREEEPEHSVLRLLVPDGLNRTLMVGPLTTSEDPLGIVILAALPGQLFAPEHEALMEELGEPFSAALENDRRLREMDALREAAEADRSSLLSRLGRQTLGDTIVGEDSGLQPVMQRVELVAKSDVPVLIFGETGTGKELVARAIHTRSSRAPAPFMRVNCGAIPAELIDSQLFGHERGSFTGATDMHRGWFERADHGTLFLDEIGELPHAAQVRLLRVLQDGMFERVGGQQSITVDVRIIAATHRDLSGMVREGRFREDLWYRLAVFPIPLPPLRERREDIPALAQHFAQRAAIRFGLAPRMPSAEDIGLLVSYAWPGNVRELGAVLDRAAILGDGRTLEVAKALGVQTDSAAPLAPSPGLEQLQAAKILPLDEVMRQHIEKTLATTRGRIEGPYGAAAILEINPHTLRARMRKLSIDWKKFRGHGAKDAEPSEECY